jgi:REP element-mobilizing transposase RayT
MSMARPLRIEYAGAVYHVLNRGNYRQDVFAVAGSGVSFEQTLFETCARFGWRLHAYVLMSNHYHLCVETTDGRLATGMQWLQSTFANRFNRLVHDRGHVFQGRYKALLIEAGDSLLRVVNYIHLNPVRAGLRRVETLGDYELSSFPKFFRRGRPECLVNSNWLDLAGGLQPTRAGMRCYQRYLVLLEAEDPSEQAALHQQLCRGWYIGTREGKKALIQKLAKGDLAAERGAEVAGYGVERAEVLLEEGLRRLGKNGSDLRSDRKLAVWKVVLAGWIKQHCGVTNRWFSETLHMGNLYGISKAVAQERKKPRQAALWRTIQTPISKA